MKQKEKPLSLGQKIKRLRRDRDLSQTELARKLGTTLVTISSYENDKTKPSSEMLMGLAKFFNVSVDYLLRDQADHSGPVSIQDKELLKQFEKIDRLNDNERTHVKYLLQTIIDKEKFKELAKEAV